MYILHKRDDCAALLIEIYRNYKKIAAQDRKTLKILYVKIIEAR
jgi:hypothetical protein